MEGGVAVGDENKVPWCGGSESRPPNSTQRPCQGRLLPLSGLGPEWGFVVEGRNMEGGGAVGGEKQVHGVWR